MNPMLQNLNKTTVNQNIAQIKNMMRSIGNPQMMLNQMMMRNPQYNQVMEYIKQNGGDPKTAFYKMAQEKGVDPNEILRQLNS